MRSEELRCSAVGWRVMETFSVGASSALRIGCGVFGESTPVVRILCDDIVAVTGDDDPCRHGRVRDYNVATKLTIVGIIGIIDM